MQLAHASTELTDQFIVVHSAIVFARHVPRVHEIVTVLDLLGFGGRRRWSTVFGQGQGVHALNTNVLFGHFGYK